jgi:CubicO group peptidase (beta-lactamase class C family)
VADVWPDFAPAGKAAITTRQLLTHRAGLPAVRRRLRPGAMLEWDTMVAALAAQEPWWPPGTAHGYHTNTFGFLVGEVLRRVTGRRPGTLVADEIARPLGADVHLGLPASEDGRTADYLLPGLRPAEEEPAGLSDDELMHFNTYFNPSGLSGIGVVNTRAWRAAVIPSTNLHASARGVARVYAALAAGGAVDGTRVVDTGALADATAEQVSGPDLILHRPNRFGLGFQLTQPERPLGPNPRAFGHFGAGGSLGFADPDAGVAFGYVMNQLGPRWQNPRNGALIEAVYASLPGS